MIQKQLLEVWNSIKLFPPLWRDITDSLEIPSTTYLCSKYLILIFQYKSGVHFLKEEKSFYCTWQKKKIDIKVASQKIQFLLKNKLNRSTA